jgi:hypothetical protein
LLPFIPIGSFHEFTASEVHCQRCKVVDPSIICNISALLCFWNIRKRESAEKGLRVKLINIYLRDTIVGKPVTYFWMRENESAAQNA